MVKHIKVLVKKIENGTLPKYTRKGDACMDCYARLDSDITLKKGKRVQVPLGFALEFKKGYECQIRGRSGLARDGIDIALGTGEYTYRGEYQATVINNSGKDFVITNGMRICQMAIRPVPFVSLQEVSELSETERGTQGFGSSGL